MREAVLDAAEGADMLMVREICGNSATFYTVCGGGSVVGFDRRCRWRAVLLCACCAFVIIFGVGIVLMVNPTRQTELAEGVDIIAVGDVSNCTGNPPIACILIKCFCTTGEAWHAVLGPDSPSEAELSPAHLGIPRVWGVRHDKGGRGKGMAGREGRGTGGTSSFLCAFLSALLFRSLIRTRRHGGSLLVGSFWKTFGKCFRSTSRFSDILWYSRGIPYPGAE